MKRSYGIIDPKHYDRLNTSLSHGSLMILRSMSAYLLFVFLPIFSCPAAYTSPLHPFAETLNYRDSKFEQDYGGLHSARWNTYEDSQPPEIHARTDSKQQQLEKIPTSLYFPMQDSGETQDSPRSPRFGRQSSTLAQASSSKSSSAQSWHHDMRPAPWQGKLPLQVQDSKPSSQIHSIDPLETIPSPKIVRNHGVPPERPTQKASGNRKGSRFRKYFNFCQGKLPKTVVPFQDDYVSPKPSGDAGVGTEFGPEITCGSLFVAFKKAGTKKKEPQNVVRLQKDSITEMWQPPEQLQHQKAEESKKPKPLSSWGQGLMPDFQGMMRR